jgi:SAM-dependent methyltransferase
MMDDYNNPPHEWLVKNSHLLPTGGFAFEAAVGLGSNLPLLLDHGMRVVAADRSYEAVRYVKRNFPAVMVVQADLKHFYLPLEKFDLICNFFFLEWTLINQFRSALKPGGLVVFETMTVSMLDWKPELNPDYLLHPGELREYFSEWDILDYRETWIPSHHGNRKAVASIVARVREEK